MLSFQIEIKENKSARYKHESMLTDWTTSIIMFLFCDDYAYIAIGGDCNAIDKQKLNFEY